MLTCAALLISAAAMANDSKAIWLNEPNETKYLWHDDLKPTFVYCKNRTNTHLKLYRRALMYWKGKGYLKGISIRVQVRHDCAVEELKVGYIILGGEDNIDPDHFGVTTRQMAKSKTKPKTPPTQIISAHIKLQKEYANNFKLLVHEIGHAIGLNHVDDKKSIMYRMLMYEQTDLF